MGRGNSFFSRDNFSLEGGSTLPPKKFKNLPEPKSSFSVKETHICSVVSEILSYKQKKTYYFILQDTITYPYYNVVFLSVA